MKKRLPVIITICLVTIGIVLAVVLIGRAPDPAPPQTAVVARGDLVITAPVRGNLEMTDKAFLSFGITGTVKELLVARGDSVEEDQVLARLDAPSLELNVDMAKVQVKMAQAQLKAAQAQYDKAREGWQTPAGLEFLEDAVEFLAELLGPDETAARASLDLAKLNLELAELSLEAAELNLDMGVITAPFDGVVADITIREGQALSAALLAAPAISMVSTDRMEMRGFIDELDIALVELGQEVDILLDAIRTREVKGTVAFVSPIGTVWLGVVSYETIIALDSSHEGLKDGMSATADIIIERRQDVLLIPNRAIRGAVDKPTVVVYIGGEQQEREIVPGLTDGISTEIVSGLEEGEHVLVGALPAASSRPRGPFGMMR